MVHISVREYKKRWSEIRQSNFSAKQKFSTGLCKMIISSCKEQDASQLSSTEH